MKNRRILPVLLAGIIGISAPASAFAAEVDLGVLQAQEASLAAAQENISSLESKKQELENYLAQLNGEYTALTGDVEGLALKAGQKEEELRQVKEELEAAKADEQKQYEAMKLRMVYIYEHGGSSFLETLLSCESIAEFLNRAEYIQQITDYDRNMLKKYEETKNLISQKEQTIQEEVEKINRIRSEGAQKQQEMRDLVASTNENIQNYVQEIASSQEEAAALLAQVTETQSSVYELLAVTQQQEAANSDRNAELAEGTASTEKQQESSLYPEGYNPEEDTLESSSSAVNSEVTVEVDSDAVEASYVTSQEQYVGEEEASQPQEIYEEPQYEEIQPEETYQEPENYEEPSGSGEGQGTYLGTFTLTAYCGCAQCCGAAGQPTASGVMPTAGHTVAMAGVPFGTQLLINGVVYTVEDLGTPYGHVDIYFDSHDAALAFGLQSAEVYQL